MNKKTIKILVIISFVIMVISAFTNIFPQESTIIEMNCEPNINAIKALVDGLVGEYKFTGKPVLH